MATTAPSPVPSSLGPLGPTLSPHSARGSPSTPLMMVPSPPAPVASPVPTATPNAVPTIAAAVAAAAVVPHSYHLKYQGHFGALSRSLLALLGESHCADVQLSTGYHAETIRAHRLILSACSPYFKSLFSALPSASFSSSPVIIIREITYETLCAIIEFCYRGKCILFHLLPFLTSTATPAAVSSEFNNKKLYCTACVVYSKHK